MQGQTHIIVGSLTTRRELSSLTMHWEISNNLRNKIIRLRLIFMENHKRLKRSRDKGQPLARGEWQPCPRLPACFQDLLANK